MARLDSIFKKRLYDIKIKYCILLYDKDTTIIQKQEISCHLTIIR